MFITPLSSTIYINWLLFFISSSLSIALLSRIMLHDAPSYFQSTVNDCKKIRTRSIAPPFQNPFQGPLCTSKLGRLMKISAIFGARGYVWSA
ncbi:hypothetical protein QVD17_19869 [Tagetes erecta]|uniref:Uncharacterized protein n=1 Tax=Tagetes erecta TaxID=13708 RepID=A0AAD8KKP8_TARER|nr:hypothetical protein QVD17_19869 [Tagetes erecta]